MPIKIPMPRLSQTTEEVRLTRWLVKIGDTVNKGDPLCEVETDKTTTQVESFERGTVLFLGTKSNSIVDAGKVIAILGAPGENVTEEMIKNYIYTNKVKPSGKNKSASNKFAVGANPTEDINPKKVVNTGTSTAYNIKVTPLVQNLAKKQKINLSLVKGTGAQGLITKKDLERYIESSRKTLVTQKDMLSENVPISIKKSLSKNQESVALKMHKSKTAIPHWYVRTTVYMDRFMELIEQNRKKYGNKLSVYSLFIYGTARSLQEYPTLNGYFKKSEVVLSKRVNIGFAVEVGGELLVPVIHGADRKSLEEINSEVRRLVKKARNGKLEALNISDGTFTVTNLGKYSVDEFYGIINYPQLGLLAMGKIKKTLVIDENDMMSIKTACNVTGSFDHRYVNGVAGAVFLQKFKQTMEEL